MEIKKITDKDYNSTITVPESGVFDLSMGESDINKIVGTLKKDKRIDRLLIPEICIRKRTKSLAKEIYQDFSHCEHMDILIVLTGAFIFASDLGRELYSLYGPNISYHLIKTSVYDKSIKGTEDNYRAVQLELEPKDIKGKDILVVEDIADQGFTLTWLLNYLKQERRVNSIKICSLLYKILKEPSSDVKKLRDNLVIDYTGFNIPDIWIAGYGIDAGHDFRNLPFIISVNESYYT